MTSSSSINSLYSSILDSLTAASDSTESSSSSSSSSSNVTYSSSSADGTPVIIEKDADGNIISIMSVSGNKTSDGSDSSDQSSLDLYT